MFFHECPYCEFIFKDSSIYPSYEDEKKQYDYHQNDEDNIGYVNYLNDFIQSAVFPFMKNGHILDFGSGPNPVLAKLLKNQYGYQVDIYDYYYHHDLDYKNRTYDMITSTEVIEHLRNPMNYFNQFHDLLNPKGYLSMMTLFHPKNQEHFFKWFYIRDITHVSFYTVKTIEVIAEKTGFDMVYTNHHRYIVLIKK
jgi:SAM-dependent methyltransferase